MEKELKIIAETVGVVKVFDVGDLKLQSGMTLKCAKIVAKLFGSPENPCIIFPTWYSGTHEDNGKQKTIKSSVKILILCFDHRVANWK